MMQNPAKSAYSSDEKGMKINELRLSEDEPFYFETVYECVPKLSEYIQQTQNTLTPSIEGAKQKRRIKIL